MNTNSFSQRKLLFGVATIVLSTLAITTLFKSDDKKIEVVVNNHNVAHPPTSQQSPNEEKTPSTSTTFNIQQTIVNINTPSENPQDGEKSTKKEDNEPSAVAPQPKKLPKQENNNVVLHKMLQGEWELVSYHLYDDGDYFSVPVTKDKIELRESWNFNENRFRHIMDKTLTFSGKYSLLEPVSLPHPPQALQNSSTFTLYCTKIYSSFGSKKQQKHYYGELKEEKLILYYLGSEVQSNMQPKQGHEFRKILPEQSR